jgi:hypothetical protein
VIPLLDGITLANLGWLDNPHKIVCVREATKVLKTVIDQKSAYELAENPVRRLQDMDPKVLQGVLDSLTKSVAVEVDAS